MNLFLGVFFEKIGGKWEFIFLNFFSLRRAASFALAHKWRFSEFWASQWHYSIYLLLFFIIVSVQASKWTVVAKS